MKINETNYYLGTCATFTYHGTSLSDIIAEYGEPNLKSKEGSCYWVFDTGVLRYSDHWGEVAKNNWELDENGEFMLSMCDYVAAFATFESFTVSENSPLYVL